MVEAVKAATSIVTMKDVQFVYTSVSEAKKQLNKDDKPPLSLDPLEFHSYEIKILIPERRFKKELRAPYPTAKNVTNAKFLSPEDANAQYGTPLDSEDDFAVVKFSQTALVGKAGARKPSRPLQQIGIAGRVQDAKGLEVGYETSVGNGSTGHFQFRPVEGGHGVYLYPHLVCITDLVVYSSVLEEDEDSLGLEALGDVAVNDMDALGIEDAPAAPSESPVDDDDFPF